MEKTSKAAAVFEEIRRNVAGIDIAWRADHYVCGPRREDGQCEIESFGTTTPELHRMVNWLKERHVESVAMESTSVYWIPAADLLESNGIEVVLVDPREVRMVPGRKSDVKDCQWLQKLHSCGLLRGAFRPPEAITAVRSVLRERDTLQAMRTQAIQQMQKSLDQMNVRVHHAVSDIDGKTGTAIVQAIVSGERDPLKLAALRDRRCKKSEKEIADHLTGTWREEHLFNLGQAFKTLQFLDDRLEEYDMKVESMFASLAKASSSCDNDEQSPPRPLDDVNTLAMNALSDDSYDNREPSPASPLCPPSKISTAKELRDIIEKNIIHQIMGFNILMIAGIGYRTARIIVSELGTNFDRFPDEKHFASYIGLAPALSKSAGKNSLLKKGCQNTSRAGQALRMAASTLYRSKSELGAYLRSVARQADKKTAIKATARRIAHMIYRGVRYGKEYVDNGAEAFEARIRERTVKTVNRLIKSYNINSSEISALTA